MKRTISGLVFATLMVFPAAIFAAPAQTTLTVTVTGGTLAATMTMPQGDGPFPAALIIAGSGPTDRDGNGPLAQTDAYKLLAQGLAARGIASLRYDKRTIGASTLPGVSEGDLRFDDFVRDAVTLVDFLHQDRRFTSITLIGHSEGSLIAMLAAQRAANVSSYVSIEGAGRNGADALKAQLTPPRLPTKYVAQVDADLDTLRGGKTVGALQTPYPSLNALFRPSVQPYMISWFKYDPAQEAAKLRIPVLIVQGTTDLQVGVTDAKRLASSNPSAQLVIIEGMNHVLRDAPADMGQNFATYSQPTLPLNARVISSIVDFMKSHGLQK